MNVHLHLY